ncbi:L-aspartate oxidase [Bombella favorum]|uniref:L-aspartate oxidase n=1 Tax=Bombella favorum TaxID=2039164 RepID=A0ABR5ZMY5_9PROT|nr:L-aspartate oxidase [Bombella favorum]MBA5725696.1 L-aspartate oxidase [Bombella favorum]
MQGHILSRYAGWPVIVGAGLAGLMAALELDGPCVLLAPSFTGEGTSSTLAQGGMAAAVGLDDSPASHAEDTLKAGAGLCDPAIVQRITEAGPQAVETLLRLGVPLARDENGRLALHLEAAHSHNRIIFAGGDRSGQVILQHILQQAQKKKNIHWLQATLEGFHAPDGTMQGLWSSAGFIPTRHCILASGGCGGLYQHTTSPLANRGMTLALAAQAGATVRDMEFTQFHPTALVTPDQTSRLSLISEAVRGAGAVLRLDDGQRFTEELAPRDVVSRAIAAQLRAGRTVFLDGRSLPGEPFSTRFPGITQACRKAGLNPDTQLLPVQPAMHYHMGGLKVDQTGRTTLKGLWACGEVACTGLHGANRLASNSLLEALVCGQWAGQDVNAHQDTARSLITTAPERPTFTTDWPFRAEMQQHLGILRTRKGLEEFLGRTLPLARQNLCALTASFIGWAALHRPEQRGAHWREDTPGLQPPRHLDLHINDLPL